MNDADHIYVHVPFCDGKCAYCAFYSEPFTAETADSYLAALAVELEQVPTGHAPGTVYFGGGTPSILDTNRLERLCNLLLGRISTDRLTEWTVEANPGTLPAEKVRMLREAGINRISIGAQSFDDAVLKRIGRRHTALDTARTLDIVRGCGIENVGLDLIACLPDVSKDSWLSTLRAAADLAPDHVSVYALSVEPGSAFSREGLTEPAEGVVLAALGTAHGLLTAAGYDRYEISNYGRPGRECAHNLACWRGEDYLGFGPAAASRSGLRRWTNRPDTGRYSHALLAGKPAPRDEETLRPGADATERLMFAFRLSEGIPVDRLENADMELTEHWRNTLARLGTEGLVRCRGNRWLPTERGRALADHIAAELIMS